MATVIIPFSSFIAEWSTECCDWLNQNIGSCGITWKANTCKHLTGYAEFWFEDEKDAIAFKLRWM